MSGRLGNLVGDAANETTVSLYHYMLSLSQIHMIIILLTLDDMPYFSQNGLRIILPHRCPYSYISQPSSHPQKVR